MACLAVFLFGLLLAAGCNNTHRDGFSADSSGTAPFFVIVPTAETLTAGGNNLISVKYVNFRIQDINSEGAELSLKIVDISMPDICDGQPCFVVPQCLNPDVPGCTFDCEEICLPKNPDQTSNPAWPDCARWQQCVFPLLSCFEGCETGSCISAPGELPGFRSFRFNLFSDCTRVPFGGVSADITFRASDEDGGETFLTLTIRDVGPPL